MNPRYPLLGLLSVAIIGGFYFSTASSRDSQKTGAHKTPNNTYPLSTNAKVPFESGLDKEYVRPSLGELELKVDAALKKLQSLSPQAAAEELLILKSQLSDEAFRQIADPYICRIIQDVDFTCGWICALPDSIENKLLFTLTGANLAGVSSLHLEGMCRTLPEGLRRRELGNSLIFEHAKNDSITALRIADDLKIGVTSNLAQAMAKTALASGQISQFCNLLNSFSDKSSDSMESAVRSWAGSSPEAAAEWVTVNKTTPNLMAALIQGWVEQNPLKASSWLKAQDNSPARDGAVVALAQYLLRNTPGDGIVWARSIVDRELRERTLKQISAHWHQVDSIGAEGQLKALLTQEEYSIINAPSAK